MLFCKCWTALPDLIYSNVNHKHSFSSCFVVSLFSGESSLLKKRIKGKDEVDLTFFPSLFPQQKRMCTGDSEVIICFYANQLGVSQNDGTREFHNVEFENRQKNNGLHRMQAQENHYRGNVKTSRTQ